MTIAFVSVGHYPSVAQVRHQTRLQSCHMRRNTLNNSCSFTPQIQHHRRFQSTLLRQSENQTCIRQQQHSKIQPSMVLPDAALKSITVLVVGSGGREHALVDKLSQSPYLKKLMSVPGNVGMKGTCECIPQISSDDIDGIVDIAKTRDVDLVVIGPEVPLVNGLVDKLKEEKILSFGPNANAAQLEGSKVFSKCFFERHKIPTAEFAAFNDAHHAKLYARELGPPLVIKAAGLAAGKGVILTRDIDSAFETIDDMLIRKRFGEAGEEVIIERLLTGEELSFFAIIENSNNNNEKMATALPLASAQDHKKAFDGDKGPNTGGMGAYSPAPLCDEKMTKKIMDDIVIPTVKGMDEEGNPFSGILYVGLMVDPETKKFKVLEYNVRFGDPECQVLCARMKSDLLELLYRSAAGRLSDKEFQLEWHDESALVVVMATNGYPGKYEKGSIIKGIDKADSIDGAKVYHAGTAASNDNIIANGGRVLNVTAKGKSIKDAQEKAYQAVDTIDWPEGFCRRDIGWRALSKEVDANEKSPATTGSGKSV